MIFRDRYSEARLRRRRGVETPYPVNWKAQTLPEQIVQRGADGALRRGVPPQRAIQLNFNGLERHWISSLEMRLELSERRDDGGDRFTIIAIGRGLAEALQSIVIGDAHYHIPMVRVSASRYDERVRWLELDCLVRELQHSNSGETLE